MASRNAQTWSKRAREQAVKERRDRKRAKKAERAAGRDATAVGGLEHLIAPVADEPAAGEQS